MKMKKMVVVFVLCLAVASQAASIAVTNYSFEQPGTDKIKGWNGENGTDIPGWASDTAAVDSGVESAWPGHTEGLWSGFLMGGDPSVWNLTDHIIAAGEVFRVKVDARDNWTGGGLADFQVSLYYDVAGVRNTVASIIFTDISQTWTTYTLKFTADDVAASIGNPLGIELKNVVASNSWLGIDNVRLATVPEPATMLLLGLGGLMALKRVKK